MSLEATRSLLISSATVPLMPDNVIGVKMSTVVRGEPAGVTAA